MIVRASRRIASVVVIALLVALFPVGLSGASAGEVTISGITSADLRAVSFVSATTGFAAASNGEIWKTTNGGEGWTKVRNADTYSFVGIDFWNANKGVAVDAQGRVAQTTSGGGVGSWTNVDFTPYPDMDQTLALAHGKVACVPGSSVDAVAAAGDPNNGDDNTIGAVPMHTWGALEFWGNPNSLMLKPHVWYNEFGDPYAAGEGLLLDVDFFDSARGWVAGIDYWPLDADNPSKFPVYTSTDGGYTWVPRSFGTTDVRLEGVSLGSTTSGVVVGTLVSDGSPRAYYSTNGGAAFSPGTLPSSPPLTGALYSVDMADATNGWAVGAGGAIIRTANGGQTWTRCTSPTAATLYDVEFIPGTTTGWAVGAAGTVVKTTDGTTWTNPGSPGNDAPVAVADSYTTAQDTPKAVPAPGVLGNDYDPDGDPITAVKMSDPSHGSVTLSANGSFTYTPNAGWTGVDSFTYRATDGSLNSGTVAVTITVTPPNHAPVAVADTYGTPEDTPLVEPAAGVLANDSDPDNDAITAVKATNPSHGSVTLSANGSFTYTPNLNWSGVDSFTYHAYDGSLYSNTVSVTITVSAVNDPPVAVGDSYTTPKDTPKTVTAPGVLANDTDVESPAGLTAIKVTNPSHGSVTLNANGSFTYTPDAGWTGVDSFTYRAYDGTTYSNTVPVTITVTSPLPSGLIRIAGSNRYATSVKASVQGFPQGAATVVIATGANWPDALGGSALAGAVGGPLLLTKPGELPPEVAAEIARLKATKAYILGSTGSVSGAVETALKGKGLAVLRLGGVNRYDTARLVADETIRLLGSSYQAHAFVATGANFPDATGAAPVAAALGRPILLANPATGAVYVPSATKRVAILGSSSSVPSQIESALKGKLGASNVSRLAGANRYATAALAAQLGVDAGMRWDGVGVATGTNFPDALSGGAMLGRLNSVMLLTRPDTLSPEAAAKLSANKAAIGTAFVFGDTGAVSTAVANAVKAAAGL